MQASALPRHSRCVDLSSNSYICILCVHTSQSYCLFSLHAFADAAHGAAVVSLLVDAQGIRAAPTAGHRSIRE